MIHTAKDRTPFTYVITNTITNKKYYGCRYAKGCHPNDLWNTYFTSSKIIKKLIADLGSGCWLVEIRQIFNDITDCKYWEERVLRKLKIPTNPKWYNQSIGGRTFLLQGESLEQQKKAVSAKMIWLHEQPEYKEYRKEIQKNRWSKTGSKEQHSKTIKEYWNDPVWVEKVIKDRKLRQADPGIRQKKSECMIAVWTRPDYIEKHKAAMEEVRADPAWLENNRVKQKEAWKDPVKRENRLKNRKPHTEERKANQSVMTSDQNKQSWANPETRQRRIDGIKAAAAKKKAAKAASILADQDQL